MGRDIDQSDTRGECIDMLKGKGVKIIEKQCQCYAPTSWREGRHPTVAIGPLLVISSKKAREHKPHAALHRPSSNATALVAPMRDPGSFQWRYLAGENGRVVPGVICFSALRPTDRISAQKTY